MYRASYFLFPTELSIAADDAAVHSQSSFA